MSEPQSQTRLRWGVLGSGEIATVFCNALRFSHTGILYAIASEHSRGAERLGARFGCHHCYSSYAELLADANVDVVYIANLNMDHARCAIAAARARKHILVEKPLALNAIEAQRVINAARVADVFLMEGFMYRCHPQLRTARSLLSSGTIGEVRHIEASFGYVASEDPNARIYRPEWGGGALLDVGCYPVSMARWVAGATQDLPFAEPDVLRAAGVIGPTGVDLHSSAVLTFSGGLIATLSTSVMADLPNHVVITGTQGALIFSEPWLPSTRCRDSAVPLPEDTTFPSATLTIRRATGLHRATEERVVIDVDRDLFSYEIDAVAAKLARRQAPEMSWADSLGNLSTLDRWREALYDK